MKTRAQEASEKTQLRSRSVPKCRKLEVYIEITPPTEHRQHYSPPPPDQPSASTTIPTQHVINAQPEPPRAVNNPTPPTDPVVAFSSQSLDQPSASITVPSHHVMDAKPEPPREVNHPTPPANPVVAPGAASAPPPTSPFSSVPTVPAPQSALSSPLLPPAASASPSPVQAVASRPVLSPPPAVPAVPKAPVIPALRQGPPPIPPVWTPPTISTRPRPLEDANATMELAAKHASTVNSGEHGEFLLEQSRDVPCVDFSQIQQSNHFADSQLACTLEHNTRERTPPPPDKLFDYDHLPALSPPMPSFPTLSLPPVSSAQIDEQDGELLHQEDDIEPPWRLRRKSNTERKVQFASDDGTDDKYNKGDESEESARDNELEEDLEAEDDDELANVKVKKKGNSGLASGKKPAKSSPRSPKRQAPKSENSKATGKKLPLYVDEEEEEDPENDPDALQYKPHAQKYAHTPGPLSKECLAEVNQLVEEFDAKMNAIGRKYRKSVASLWDAANMSKAGGIRELSTWNAFLAYRTKKEGARAGPSETNPDFVARLSTKYKELIQDLLDEDWQDPVKRRQIAREHGWLDFVQEACLEVTKEERENGIKKSTMQCCINEILKLGRIYYKLYGVILSGALYDLNNHSRSWFFGSADVVTLFKKYRFIYQCTF
ncbi:hypothetical protein K435DRAFT_862522 [Dendrothele bispora CBS 962.96]|uniref:Uncharacterized protein n=1 Tax=Dendrothele bispora (strain CBS 962.96) TaxID=1314807 RepID=A0A4S8LSJ2_DENBC|nr:hypothetical protein K435DRAFT_862522 [Dendrothele bispora CBS 962.96]